MKLVAALALVTFTAAPVPRDVPAKPKQVGIQGKWKIVCYVCDGHDRTRKLLNVPVEITDEHFVFTTRNGHELVPFAIDDKTDPKAFDLMPAPEGVKYHTFPGIYKLDKDQLSICWNRSWRTVRPKEFKSDKGSDVTLMIFERAK